MKLKARFVQDPRMKEFYGKIVAEKCPMKTSIDKIKFCCHTHKAIYCSYYKDILDEIKRFMVKEKISSLKEIIGSVKE